MKLEYTGLIRVVDQSLFSTASPYKIGITIEMRFYVYVLLHHVDFTLEYDCGSGSINTDSYLFGVLSHVVQSAVEVLIPPKCTDSDVEEL